MVQPRFRVAGDAERGVVTTEFVRDAAMTAAIFGFFAAGWYGWAQDDPPTGWRRPLPVGSITGILVAIAGGIVAWQNWSTGTVFDANTSPIFGLIVGIEVLLSWVERSCSPDEGARSSSRHGWHWWWGCTS